MITQSKMYVYIKNHHLYMILVQRGEIMAYASYSANRLVNIPEMYSCFEKDFSSDYRFEGEIHNFWECVYVKRGDICVSADERIHNLTEGEIIFHKPLELHKFNIESPRGATLLIFSYTLEGPVCETLQNKVFTLNEAQREIISGISRYMKESKGMWESSSTAPQMIAAYITQLILLLLENAEASSVATGYDAEIFRTAINYMNNHISRSVSVKDISAACHISRSGLKRIFDKYAGIGVHKYFLTLKIKTATILLQSGVGVTETANRLGFSSQGYFSAAYKRETGNNPTEVNIQK